MNQKFLKKTLFNQIGQGITEYILLLVVIVAMIFGGMYQLSTAFEEWANNYFGDYLACLLETGELPSIGGAPGDSGICNELFEPFDLANGRRLRAGEGGGGGGGGDGEDSSEDPRRGGGSGGGLREAASTSAGTYVPSSSSGGSFGRSGGGSSSQAQNISRRGREREKYTGSTESSLPAGAGYTQSGARSGRPQYIAVRGERIVDVQEREDGSIQQSSTVRRTPDSQESDKKIRIIKKEIKKETVVEDEPMTFGNFLRLLIIAAIIIALMVLLGGQALQISKGSE